MTQWIKALANKSDNLGLIFETHMVGKTSNLYMCHTHTYTEKERERVNAIKTFKRK